MGCSNCSTSGVPGGCGDTGLCSSGGCNKLNTYDWLNNIKAPDASRAFSMAEIRFKSNRKEFFRNTEGIDLEIGDWVAVEAQKGHDVGSVSLSGELVRLQMRRKGYEVSSPEVRKIYRKATELDLSKLEDCRNKEEKIRRRAVEIIERLKMEMKLSDVEFQGDQSKITFYYTAEGRVDFRELIKLLAQEFRVRIEMRQIGARQETALLGGVGACGRELCCSTWLTQFKSVNTSAARYQNLSVNPAKLAGQCGRLKCCLNFELESYMSAAKEFPSWISKLQSKEGEAEMFKKDIFKREVWYNISVERSSKTVIVSLERAKDIGNMNRKGQIPETLDDYSIEEPNIEDLEGLHSVEEGSLTRFDVSKAKKKKRRNSRSRNNRNDKSKQQ